MTDDIEEVYKWPPSRRKYREIVKSRRGPWEDDWETVLEPEVDEITNILAGSTEADDYFIMFIRKESGETSLVPAAHQAVALMAD